MKLDNDIKNDLGEDGISLIESAVNTIDFLIEKHLIIYRDSPFIFESLSDEQRNDTIAQLKNISDFCLNLELWDLYDKSIEIIDALEKTRKEEKNL